MPRTKRWNSRDDVQEYIKDLEDVYGIEVEMHIQPLPSIQGANVGRLSLIGWWQDDSDHITPMAVHSQQIALAPTENYIPTVVNALVVFTYQCVEAHLSVLHKRN